VQEGVGIDSGIIIQFETERKIEFVDKSESDRSSQG